MFNIAIINNDDLGYGVDARALYEALGSQRQFGNWITNRLRQLNAEESLDYQVFNKFVKNLQGGRPSKEYIVSLDIAKHIAMMEGTKRGKEVRKYFIECEKKYKEMNKGVSKLPSTYLEALKELVKTEEQRLLLEAENTVIKHSENTYTATQLAKDFGLPSAQFLNDILHKERIQYKKGKNWIPYAGYESWYSIKEVINNEQEQSYVTTRFTIEGKIQIEKLLESLGIL